MVVNCICITEFKKQANYTIQNINNTLVLQSFWTKGSFDFSEIEKNIIQNRAFTLREKADFLHRMMKQKRMANIQGKANEKQYSSYILEDFGVKLVGVFPEELLVSIYIKLLIFWIKTPEKYQDSVMKKITIVSKEEKNLVFIKNTSCFTIECEELSSKYILIKKEFLSNNDKERMQEYLENLLFEVIKKSNSRLLENYRTYMGWNEKYKDYSMKDLAEMEKMLVKKADMKKGRKINIEDIITKDFIYALQNYTNKNFLIFSENQKKATFFRTFLDGEKIIQKEEKITTKKSKYSDEFRTLKYIKKRPDNTNEEKVQILIDRLSKRFGIKILHGTSKWDLESLEMLEVALSIIPSHIFDLVRKNSLAVIIKNADQHSSSRVNGEYLLREQRITVYDFAFKGTAASFVRTVLHEFTHATQVISENLAGHFKLERDYAVNAGWDYIHDKYLISEKNLKNSDLGWYALTDILESWAESGSYYMVGQGDKLDEKLYQWFNQNLGREFPRIDIRVIEPKNIEENYADILLLKYGIEVETTEKLNKKQWEAIDTVLDNFMRICPYTMLEKVKKIKIDFPFFCFRSTGKYKEADKSISLHLPNHNFENIETILENVLINTLTLKSVKKIKSEKNYRNIFLPVIYSLVIDKFSIIRYKKDLPQDILFRFEYIHSIETAA